MIMLENLLIKSNFCKGTKLLKIKVFAGEKSSGDNQNKNFEKKFENTILIRVLPNMVLKNLSFSQICPFLRWIKYSEAMDK